MTTECKTGLLMVEPCCLSSTQCSAWQKEQTKPPIADNLWGGHALLYGILAHLDAGCMWDCAVHGLDLAPFVASLLVPLVILWVVDCKQVIEVKQIIDPQQVHS